MSFQNKNFWMQRDDGCLINGKRGFDTPSRIEPKRAHQWIMDASDQELFSNKKRQTEVANGRPMEGNSNVNTSLCENASGFQSIPGQFTNRLFGPDPLQNFNTPGRNISSVGIGNLHTERRAFDDQFGNQSLVSLSMSNATEDLSYLSHGIKKVKVNQVRNSVNDMPASLGYSYSRGDSNTISVSTTYDKSDNNIALGPTYGSGVAPAFRKVDENFISMGHTFNKGDGSFMLMGHSYNKGNDGILLMGQPFDKGDGGFIAVDQRYEKEDANVMSSNPTYNKGHENFISIGPSYNNANQSFISMDSSYHKGDDIMISVDATNDKADTGAVSIGTTYEHEDSSIPSMNQNLDKGEGITISFGGFHDESETNNPSGGIISNYDMLMGQSFVQASKEPGQKDSVENNNADPAVTVAPATASRTDTASKSKEQKAPKKIPPNSFPSNVKSLLSTGILDGVPVKYVSWSREKNLQGIIKGTSYLCGCKDCQLSKALNAYEFERHAGCKTKHPNNHIYFENGKTIYSVVQELKNTPQELLFDAIQNVTGSPVNQKNFRIWKESYLAATRELQRIYGKEVTLAS